MTFRNDPLKTIVDQACKVLSFTFPHAGCYTYTLSSSKGQSYKIVLLCNQEGQTQRFAYNAQGEKTSALTFGQASKTDSTPSYQAPEQATQKQETQKAKTSQKPQTQEEEEENAPAMRTSQTQTRVTTHDESDDHHHVMKTKGVATGDQTHILIYVLLCGLSFILIRKCRGSL